MSPKCRNSRFDRCPRSRKQTQPNHASQGMPRSARHPWALSFGGEGVNDPHVSLDGFGETESCLLSCRTDRESVFAAALWANRLILFGIGAELALILTIDYTRWGNALFSTAPIGLQAWLFVIPFAVGMLILEEFRKYFARRFISGLHR
jgi:hypothetical protein